MAKIDGRTNFWIGGLPYVRMGPKRAQRDGSVVQRTGGLPVRSPDAGDAYYGYLIVDDQGERVSPYAPTPIRRSKQRVEE